MNRSNKILAALLVVQIALIFVTHRQGDTHSIAKTTELFPSLDKDKVTEVEVWADGGDKAAVVLKREAEGWQVASHEGYPVTESKITSALHALEAASSRRAIASGPERFRQLGVAEDEYERLVVLRDAEGEHKFYVGNAAGHGKTALRLAESEDVYALDTIKSGTFSKEVTDWVDPSYFSVEKDKIESISLSNAQGDFSLQKTDGQWQVKVGDAPLAIAEGKEIKVSAIESVLRQLSSIRLVKPVSAKIIQSAPTASALLRGAAEEDKASEEWTIEFYEIDDKLIARDQSNAFYVEVNSSALSDVMGLDQEKLLKDKDKEKGDDTTASKGVKLPMPGGLPH